MPDFILPYLLSDIQYIIIITLYNMCNRGYKIYNAWSLFKQKIFLVIELRTELLDVTLKYYIYWTNVTSALLHFYIQIDDRDVMMYWEWFHQYWKLKTPSLKIWKRRKYHCNKSTKMITAFCCNIASCKRKMMVISNSYKTYP